LAKNCIEGIHGIIGLKWNDKLNLVFYYIKSISKNAVFQILAKKSGENIQ
jgi:hypothetical protein